MDRIQTRVCKAASVVGIVNLTKMHILYWLLAAVGFPTVGVTVEPPRRRAGVEFTNDLIPVLTKNGCNAGACHGAAIGRGGFKLSLYGSNPSADFESIVRMVGGRRINLARPEESLVVLKPAEYVEHGGGGLFDFESHDAQLLVEWIKQGARSDSSRKLLQVKVHPQRQVGQAHQSIPLSAMAFYSDGSRRDVTRWTIFSPEDTSAVEVVGNSIERSPKSGGGAGHRLPAERSNVQFVATAKVLRPGRHIVVARYLNQVVPIELVVPLSSAKLDRTREPSENFVDAQILDSLELLGLTPSPGIDDEAFLRRLSLDLTGRLPSLELMREFRAAVAGQANRRVARAALVDQLLQSEAFTEYWTLPLAKLLRIRPSAGNVRGATIYHEWLAEQIRSNVSFRDVARQLILASGDTQENGPANFYRTVNGPREQAEFVSELFMGSRLRCANCHDHPLDVWTQDDYHGLAAIFAKVESGQTVRDKPNGKVIHPRTQEVAFPKIPGQALAEAMEREAVGREALAEWLTDSSNPYFSKAIVNRLWKQMMGRGLVEPVDDFRDTNPATHPILLNLLARDFQEHGFRLRHTLRVIATSAAYARSAQANEGNRDDDRFYSHAIRQPLEPEVLADAISDVLGVSERYGDEPVGIRAVALVSPQTPSRTLDVLGRCGRIESCESSTGGAGGLAQKLHLFNGPLLNARIAAEGGRLHGLLGSGVLPMQIIEQFYAVALVRRPTEAEVSFWTRELADSTDHPALLEDFVWSLLTSEEFCTNH